MKVSKIISKYRLSYGIVGLPNLTIPRTKCHKYWPDLDSTVMYGDMSVTCTREEIRDSFACRDFTRIHADLPGYNLLPAVILPYVEHTKN